MTTSPPIPGQRWAALGEVGTAVHNHIIRLQRGYFADRSDAVATIARLRRGVGRSVIEMPDLWGLTGTEALYDAYAVAQSSPEAEEQLRRAEEAAHTAVTLWALHQQSHHRAGMHQRHGHELGAAVRRLMPKNELDDSIRKRFVRLGTANTPTVLAQRLRDLVVLLRREAIPLDYGVLADQLELWQHPGGPEQVRGSWGRAFHSYRTTGNSSADQTDPAGADHPSTTAGPDKSDITALKDAS